MSYMDPRPEGLNSTPAPPSVVEAARSKRERPILFSAPMVRAILDGSKTQTRRVMTDRHRWHFESIGDLALCPFGMPSDRLWVRETWGVADEWLHECVTEPPRTIAYRANLAAHNFDPAYAVNTSDWGWERMRWRPSIHMPRWASRITLEVTGVRVERLQDISDKDCIAEGIGLNGAAEGVLLSGDLPESLPRAMYRDLWESIYGTGSWSENPWVWVGGFERVDGAKGA
ncbi:hypothetical protein PanNE5_29410 [Pandoraea sp. NE5]|uniref:hypothetical protein n=1 Tax=Pandoraea sp. NE5 TaxID=2904129 RepID=UPI0021C4B27D|nr:hypothetical protein [Pandoraea sp. NE5]BDD93501.1 hypothetical protein PanNE5_29410 [Pandoraea sp. NE5]